MKGVSPLIGAVVIVGITLMVAIAISSWSKSFAVSQAKKTEEETKIECSYATFGVDEAILDTTNNKLTLRLRATGSVAVEINKISVIKETYYKATYINGDDFFLPRLEPGDVEYITLTGLPSNVSEVIIIPSECPINRISITSDEMIVK